jgi:hypothetical protein
MSPSFLTKLENNLLNNGCETLSQKLREEHRLRMFENKMLRKIFGPKTEEGT